MFIQHILVKKYHFNAKNPILTPQIMPNIFFLKLTKNFLELGGGLNL